MLCVITCSIIPYRHHLNTVVANHQNAAIIIAIMKLSTALLLALAPVNNAVDSPPPNLRGIAAVALSDEESTPVMVMGDDIDFVEEEESRYGVGPHECRTITLSCSTIETMPSHFKCCSGLTCKSDSTQGSAGNGFAYDGTCVDENAAPAAPAGGGRHGPGCKTENHHCGSPGLQCCNSPPYNLVCSTETNTCVQAQEEIEEE